ncbi:MAG: GNAT family N-acetyltransferase [Chloroflexi bacterium]|nr:GNAT family N-acetyltransferase [Chloroflexota bacterium]
MEEFPVHADDVSIRSLTRADELAWVMDLQSLICGDQNEWQIPFYTLVDLVRNGGQVLAAFEGKLLVGFLIAFLGTDSRDPHRPAMANLKLVLDRIAVHPDYRGTGVATQMALRLRDIAIRQGIRLVTYAFDPLESREAYLLIRKLGAIVKRFSPDFYGVPAHDAIVPPLTTDRCLAEWWVTHNRVEERLFGQRGNLGLGQYLDAGTPILNPSEVVSDSDLVRPFSELVMVPGNSMFLIEVPADYAAISLADEALARTWQQHIRDALLTIMPNGYVITDFIYEVYEERQRAFYLLSYDGPRLTISLS